MRVLLIEDDSATAQSIESVMPEERKEMANRVISASRREKGRTLEGFAGVATAKAPVTAL